MIHEALAALRDMPGVAIFGGLDNGFTVAIRDQLGFDLPTSHLDTLLTSNGVEIYSGYVRLFGLFTQETTDGMVWNENPYWKFSWKGRCDEYWCFAETAWGDQYAYLTEDMISGRNSEVYLLDAISMTVERTLPSFEAFFGDEIVRQAEEPYDVTLRQARRKFGPLPHKMHLIHMPSLHLGGADDVAFTEVQNARSAMICNGDIATQIDEPQGTAVSGVETYLDELGRTRLRLVWT